MALTSNNKARPHPGLLCLSLRSFFLFQDPIQITTRRYVSCLFKLLLARASPQTLCVSGDLDSTGGLVRYSVSRPSAGVCLTYFSQ